MFGLLLPLLIGLEIYPEKEAGTRWLLGLATGFVWFVLYAAICWLVVRCFDNLIPNLLAWLKGE